MIYRFRRLPIAFFILFSLYSCENDLDKVKLYSKGQVIPTETAKSIKIIYSDSAKVQVEITAPILDHYSTENSYIEMPKGLVAIFYNERMEVKSKVVADYGIRYEREQKMEVRKNVIVTNEKGNTLNTEHLIWDEKKAKLTSDEDVKITTKDEIIFGKGFEANEDFTKYKIFNLKGTISINNPKND